MGLEEYAAKRNFSKTPEPKCGRGDDRKIFVIQKHRARNLHYDFRLSIGGALKSWAIPKEPPVEKGVRRLAVQTEDHPLEYAAFEGKIPEGEYGAGTVEIWDEGKYELESEKETKMVFGLFGNRLKGKYVLLKFPKGGDNAWLFFRVE